MGSGGAAGASSTMKQEEEGELRRGPWTVDEDLTLINYIAQHGEGRWNALARAAGLKRTGKSCRLRWLNYLRPDVKRGDFTADEQLLILDLHSRWGNRWSKIARQLPGRTDNEIKNYWRTRVQKHARQLNCDVNSRRFKDAMKYLWMPRLAERAASTQHQQQAAAGDDSSSLSSALVATTPPAAVAETNSCYYYYCQSPGNGGGVLVPRPSSSSSDSSLTSTESTSSALHEEKSVHQLMTGHAGGGGDSFVWAMQGADVVDHEFWYSAAAQQQLHDDGVQEVTGWVQGFAEGGTDTDQYRQSLWSLDDVWRMH